MSRIVYLLVACLLACGPPAQQAPVKQPDLEPYHGCGIPSTAENPAPCGSTAGQNNPAPVPDVGTKPRLADLAEKTVSAQCQLLLPRLRACKDELLVEFARSIVRAPDQAELLQAELAANSTESPDRGVMFICELYALADSSYVSSVLGCWDESPCELFSACVHPTSALPPTTSKLDHLAVAAPTPDGYDRKDWKHWIDADKDCQNTRQEVLIEESEIPVTFKTTKQCKVLTGRWTCPYTGEVFTDPRKLDVHHMIPLAAAHAAGGYAWDSDKKQAFANEIGDPNLLIAVSASANRSKGKRGPDQWQPPNVSYVCQYLHNWAAIKMAWKLSVSKNERVALENGFKFNCADDGPSELPRCVNSNDPLCGL